MKSLILFATMCAVITSGSSLTHENSDFNELVNIPTSNSGAEEKAPREKREFILGWFDSDSRERRYGDRYNQGYGYNQGM